MATTVNGARCPDHPSESLVYCGPCSSEILASGNPEDRARWQARIRNAEAEERFPLRFKSATADHPEVLEWLAKWSESDAECPSLLLAGTVGVGKTWQAYGALRAAVTGARPTTWIAVTSADLYASLRPRAGHDTEAELERYRATGLLLIDDLGAAKASEWVEETTYRVLNGRYEDMRPSIFTTNLPIPTLKGAIGDRIASRLAETCQRVVMEGGDRRRSASLPTVKLPRPTEPDPEAARAAEWNKPAVDIWA
jgi:DNA replication protein DnaC